MKYQIFGDEQGNLLDYLDLKKPLLSSILSLIISCFFFTGEREDVYVLAQESLGSICRYDRDKVASSYSDDCRARHAIFLPSQASVPGGGGGGGSPRKMVWGCAVRPDPQDLYPIYDQSRRFFLPYF